MFLQIVLPLDIAMDLGMLLTAQLVFGSFRPRRLFSAALMLFVCTVLIKSLGLSASSAAAIHFPVFLLSASIVTGAQRPGRILEAAACMFCAGAAAAGFLSLGKRASAPAVILGIPLFLCLLRKHRHENYRWNIEVYVEKDGLGASLPALIDTGNRLHEHRSGLPVLIAEAGALPRLAQHMQTLPLEQLRVLPFGVLGSTGEISCFLPDKLEILLPGKGPVPAPDCWVAVYPGRIPGNTRALAPPAFTKALELKHNIFRRHFIE